MEIVIDGCVFENNKAQADGGAVYLRKGFQMTVSIKASYFTSNRAGRSGGGIFSENLKNLTIENTTFSGNSAQDDGGGMYSVVSKYTYLLTTQCFP